MKFLRVGLILGIITSGLLLIIGLSTRQFETYSVISGTLGIICFLLAGIVSDSFISGNHSRANYFTENKSDRKKECDIPIYFSSWGLQTYLWL
ncbi:DUF5316 family protein [Bacillus timonensis]|uniref:DUF5316 family protein n=1 Tax=Bacillus timonensis TaxID=1033734 RepID=UPI0002899130|nr:DUF5316 family protein [Bacillus timonensis]